MDAEAEHQDKSRNKPAGVRIEGLQEQLDQREHKGK